MPRSRSRSSEGERREKRKRRERNSEERDKDRDRHRDRRDRERDRRRRRRRDSRSPEHRDRDRDRNRDRDRDRRDRDRNRDRDQDRDRDRDRDRRRRRERERGGRGEASEGPHKDETAEERDARLAKEKADREKRAKRMMRHWKWFKKTEEQLNESKKYKDHGELEEKQKAASLTHQEVKPHSTSEMIEITLNDRLGKKVRVKCNQDDTIGDIKLLAAAQLGTKPEKIRIQKWYTIYKDAIRLCDYEIHDNMNLELYYN